MHVRDIPESARVALTTPERADMFRSALGDGADLRFDPHEGEELCEFISRCASGGCRLLVLDEAYFIRIGDMVNGIQQYVDDPHARAGQPDIVLVCSQREAGDWLLAFYATYCGIYDIVFGCEGGELVAELADVVAHPRQRKDVVGLICRDQRLASVAVSTAREAVADEARSVFESGARRFFLEGDSVKGEVQNNPGEININIKIEIPS